MIDSYWQEVRYLILQAPNYPLNHLINTMGSFEACKKAAFNVDMIRQLILIPLDGS
jgi:hypothetical protein